jgi:PhzF family phenazine biosynthesis protein
MKIPYFQVNSFTGKGFRGNPAGVCLLDKWISAELMQKVATENNLSETAFVVKKDHDFEIRWFTPAVEVDLCGHATLASGFVLYELKKEDADCLRFHSRSGVLSVSKNHGSIIMDFPSDKLTKSDMGKYADAFTSKPLEVWKGKTDLLAVFQSEDDIRYMKPDMNILMSMKERGVIVTAPGTKVDFVSRFFAPQSGIPEDPVTGSAHTSLAPYWSDRLGKDKLEAWQLSERGGLIYCHIHGDRVVIEGEATMYLSGFIYV